MLSDRESRHEFAKRRKTQYCSANKKFEFCAHEHGGTNN